MKGTTLHVNPSLVYAQQESFLEFLAASADVVEEVVVSENRHGDADSTPWCVSELRVLAKVPQFFLAFPPFSRFLFFTCSHYEHV